MRWRVYYYIYDKNHKCVSYGVLVSSYIRKGNALRRAKDLIGNWPKSDCYVLCKVSQKNIFEIDAEELKKQEENV